MMGRVEVREWSRGWWKENMGGLGVMGREIGECMDRKGGGV